jgi:hypothetical protein
VVIPVHGQVVVNHVVVGFAVSKATGLYGAMSTVAAKITIGSTISIIYVVVFRRAFCAR